MVRARFEEVRDRYKTCAEEYRRPHLIAAMVAEQVGLCDEDANLYLREDGAPTLAEKPARRPSDFPLDMLAEAIIGRDWRQVLGLGSPGRLFPFTRDLLREEAAAPVGPSVMGNVAAWSATVGVLAGAQFQLGYQTSEYDLADLFPIRPAFYWQGGERYIDVLGPFEPARETAPGEEYPDTRLNALWVEGGPMKKYTGKILLTKELLEIDVSGGQFLAKARDGGKTLKLREQELTIDAVTGQLNNFKLGFLTDSSATGYNTYGPTITGPSGVSRTIPNDSVNPANDPGAMQKSDEALANLYNPVSDMPIEVQMNLALFPTPMALWANALNSTAQITLMTQTTISQAQAAAGTFPTANWTIDNPWKNLVTGRVSRWLHDRHVRSTTQPDPNRSAGLGLTGLAQYRWYRMDPQKFACRRQKWPAMDHTLNPGDYQMVVQGIAAGFAWDMATMVQVLNPYAIQRNKAI